MSATATLAGTAICCVVPLLSFAAGIYIERFGLPFRVQWRVLVKCRERGCERDLAIVFVS
jgi:hypothetical protein